MEKILGGARCKKVIKKFGDKWVGKHEFGSTKIRKTKISSTILKIIPPPPPISKKSPKYADHPPNSGYGFAALITCKDHVTTYLYFSYKFARRWGSTESVVGGTQNARRVDIGCRKADVPVLYTDYTLVCCVVLIFGRNECVRLHLRLLHAARATLHTTRVLVYT